MPQNAAMASDLTADFLIIGGGIAAASVGHALAARGTVILLERESQPGYHSTGRSAALFMESYGTPQVRALTLASRAFFDAPPAGFADHPLLTPRGALMVAEPGQEARAAGAVGRVAQRHPARAGSSTPTRPARWCPCCARERIAGAVLEPDAADMDVHAMHQGYLRGLKPRRRQRGLRCRGARAAARRRPVAGRRRAADSTRRRCVLNAAGAWADVVAQLAGVAADRAAAEAPRGLHLRAARRQWTVSAWPMAVGVGESWYIKPDAGMLLGSPANADPVEPHDVQPEELDIALGDPPHRGDDDAADPPAHAHLGRPALLRRRRRPGGRLRSCGARLLLGRRPGRLRHPDLGRHGRGLRRACPRAAPSPHASPASA